ncbi:uncharacterized protein LOC131949102 [Physella acuta]|uniref:uncharacterized protein LOC131949102 n=1 Tax=Physella acuta TaxID=109671 RepID=UPI0027DCBBB1|nr:uncharacterized protein LOC131949102 [Physella acuta]
MGREEEEVQATAKNVCPTSSNQSSLIGGVVAACAIIVSILVIIVIVYKKRERDLLRQLSAANQANIDQHQKFQEYESKKATRNTTIEIAEEDESTSGSKAIRPMSSYKESTISETDCRTGLLPRQSGKPYPGTTSTNDDQDI